MDSTISFTDRGDKPQLEEALEFAPKFDADGLIPAVALCAKTGQPLMLAYMNADSLKLTLQKGEAVYYSRSRQEIWHKGATSGHVQKLKEIRTDCDQDAIVMVVEQIGEGACHTGRSGCFYRSIPFGEDLKSDPVMMEWVDGGTKRFDPDAVYGNS